MTKSEAVQHVASKGIEVLAARNEFGTPKVTIRWQDYPMFLYPVQDAALARGDFSLAMR